jgi:hypothetical protein
MVYLGLEKPKGRWSAKSRALAEGLLLYEDGLNSLGIPQRVATDPENAGFFEVDDSLVDHSQAALEQWREQSKKPDPGVMPQVRLDERAKAAAARRRAARKAQAAAAVTAASGLGSPASAT